MAEQWEAHPARHLQRHQCMQLSDNWRGCPREVRWCQTGCFSRAPLQRKEATTQLAGRSPALQGQRQQGALLQGSFRTAPSTHCRLPLGVVGLVDTVGVVLALRAPMVRPTKMSRPVPGLCASKQPCLELIMMQQKQ